MVLIHLLRLETALGDLGSDLASGSMEATHDGADGDVEHVGSFLICQAVEVDQFDDLAKVGAEAGRVKGESPALLEYLSLSPMCLLLSPQTSKLRACRSQPTSKMTLPLN